MTRPTDNTLIRRSAQGDEHAFVELIRRYEGPLQALIRSRVFEEAPGVAGR